MAMQTIQVRISSEQLEAIERQIKAGKYQSRSEAIRDYIRKAELFDAMEELRRLVAKADLKEEEIWQDPEETRKALYQEMFKAP